MTKNKFTWENVSIGQFEQILAMSAMNKNELDKCIDILSVMTGKTSDYYKEMMLDKLQEELKCISGLNPGELKPRMANSGEYVVEGVKYKLTASAKHMTAGQFIDYQVTIENNSNDIAMLCAIFLVPEGKKYGEGYDVMELKETLYNKFPYVDAMGISFFFQKTLEVLSTVTLQSSIKKLQKEMKMEVNQEKRAKIEESILVMKKTLKTM